MSFGNWLNDTNKKVGNALFGKDDYKARVDSSVTDEQRKMMSDAAQNSQLSTNAYNSMLPAYQQSAQGLMGANYQARQIAQQNPAYQVNRQTTTDYFNNTLMPQMTQQKAASDNARNAGMAGNFWGTARTRANDAAQRNFDQSANSAYSQLAYADEQARRQALTDAANRQLQAEQANQSAGLQGNAQNIQARMGGMNAVQALDKNNTLAGLGTANTQGTTYQQQHTNGLMDYMNAAGLSAQSAGQAMKVPGVM